MQDYITTLQRNTTPEGGLRQHRASRSTKSGPKPPRARGLATISAPPTTPSLPRFAKLPRGWRRESSPWCSLLGAFRQPYPSSAAEGFSSPAW